MKAMITIMPTIPRIIRSTVPNPAPPPTGVYATGVYPGI